MRKIIILTLILVLLSSMVSAQDDVSEKPPIQIGPTIFYDDEVDATLYADVGEQKDLGIFTETTGESSASTTVEVFAQNSFGEWVQIQSNDFSAPAGSYVPLAIIINAVEITGQGQQIVTGQGETRTIYVFALNKIIRLVVTNLEAVAEPTTAAGDGGRSYTSEEKKVFENKIDSVVGTLSLIVSDQEKIAGQLNLFLNSGGGIITVLNNLLEASVWFAFGQWDIFGGLLNIFEGNPDADANNIPDSFEGRIKRLAACKCTFKMDFDVRCIIKGLEGSAYLEHVEDSGGLIPPDGNSCDPDDEKSVKECHDSCRDAAGDLAGSELERIRQHCLQSGNLDPERLTVTATPPKGKASIEAQGVCVVGYTGVFEPGSGTGTGGDGGSGGGSGPEVIPAPTNIEGVKPTASGDDSEERIIPEGYEYNPIDDSLVPKLPRTDTCTCTKGVNAYILDCNQWEPSFVREVLTGTTAVGEPSGWEDVPDSRGGIQNIEESEFGGSQRQVAFAVVDEEPGVPGGELEDDTTGEGGEINTAENLGSSAFFEWRGTQNLGPCDPSSTKCQEDCKALAVPQQAMQEAQEWLDETSERCMDPKTGPRELGPYGYSDGKCEASDSDAPAPTSG